MRCYAREDIVARIIAPRKIVDRDFTIPSGFLVKNCIAESTYERGAKVGNVTAPDVEWVNGGHVGASAVQGTDRVR
jgi:hypothetical protein